MKCLSFGTVLPSQLQEFVTWLEAREVEISSEDSFVNDVRVCPKVTLEVSTEEVLITLKYIAYGKPFIDTVKITRKCVLLSDELEFDTNLVITELDFDLILEQANAILAKGTFVNEIGLTKTVKRQK